MKSTSEISFAVIYRWKLTPGLEDGFVEGWKAVSRILEERFGALGARLHRAEDSTWVAYAQWPNRATWENARLESAEGLEAMRNMQNAVERRYESILMEPVAGSNDLLARKLQSA